MMISSLHTGSMFMVSPEIAYQPRIIEQPSFKVQHGPYHKVFGLGGQELCFPMPHLRDIPDHGEFVKNMQSLGKEYLHLRFPTAADLSMSKGRVHYIEDEMNMRADVSMHNWTVENYPTNPIIINKVSELKKVQKSKEVSFYTLGDIVELKNLKHIIDTYSHVANETGRDSSLYIWGGEKDDQETVTALEKVSQRYREAGINIFVIPYQKVDGQMKTRVLAHAKGDVLLTLAKDPQYEDALYEADTVGNQIIFPGTNATKELFYDKSVFDYKFGRHPVNEYNSRTTLANQIGKVMKSTG